MMSYLKQMESIRCPGTHVTMNPVVRQEGRSWVNVSVYAERQCRQHLLTSVKEGFVSWKKVMNQDTWILPGVAA